jgi:hypothetical protein
MRFALFLILAVASLRCLPAQQATLSGPVEALTFDAPTRSLRAVLGFPGAASFGSALLDNLDFASVAPRQNYGLAFQGSNCLLVAGLGSGPASTRAIPGVTRFPEGIAWSGNGSLAVLYSRSGNWFQSVSGFPAAPEAGQLVEVASLGGSLTAVALDPSGKQIAFAVSGANGAIYETADSQAFIPLFSIPESIALSFSSDGQTLYALDGNSLQVTAFSLGGHGFQTLQLPGITDPVAIQSGQDSQNHQLLYVAGGSDRLLRILDVTSQQIVTDVPLNFQPTSVDQFGNNSFVVARRSRSANPLWLFTNTPPAGVYFVPAIQLRRPDHKRTGIVQGAR